MPKHVVSWFTCAVYSLIFNVPLCVLLLWPTLPNESWWLLRSVKPHRVSDNVECPFRDGAALKCHNHNAANTADCQNCWMWALVWYRPIKRLVFSRSEEWLVSHLCTVDQQQSGAALQRLWCLCCSQWESLTFFPRSATSLSQSRPRSHFISAALLWKLMNSRDCLSPVSSAGDFCVEMKELGANIHETKS